MAVFSSAEQLYASLRVLFARIEAENPQAADAMLKSRLSFRFRCSDPAAVLLIDARKRPLQIAYGADNTTKPDLDVKLTTDTLHQILMGQLTLTKAVGSKKLVPTGPVWKTMTLADLFNHAKTIYPQILEEQGLD
jgi:alkyl sulfatase BDS1-like metallo-beta-lactamase superfamily hydrolase